MAAPVPVVEWSPTTDPFAAPVWVDITAYVLDVATSRKKPALQGSVQAGTCDVTLRNNDGRFDPANTSGPYYGQLDLGKRLRVRGQVGGVYYPVIDVMVETIEVSWLSQSESVARLSCADFFAVLARKRLVRDVYRSMMLATVPAPWRYGRMGQRTTPPNAWPNEVALAGVTAVAAYNPGTLGALAPALVPGALVTDDDGANDAMQNGGLGLAVPSPGTGDFGVEFWMRVAGSVAGSSVPSLLYCYSTVAGPSYHRWRLQITAGGALQIYVESTGAAVANSTSATTAVVVDSTWHHILITRSTSTTWRIYVDGALSVTLVAAVAINTANAIFLQFPGENSLPAQIDEVATFTSLPNIADYTARWTEGRGRWGRATTGARINTVLDTINWPAGLRDIDPGTEMMDAVNETTTQSSSGAGSAGGILARVSALDHMQVCADVDGGLLYVSKAGTVTFRQRTNLPAPIEATYGEQETPYAAPPVATTDKATVVNEVALTASRSSNVLAINATSQTRYGIQTQSIQVPLAPDAVRAQAKAQRIVDARAFPIERQSALALDLTTTPGAVAALGHELASGVTVRRRPGVAPMRSVDAVVAGLTHHITPDSWDLSIDLGPRYVGPVPSARWQGQAQSVVSGTYTPVPLLDPWWDDAGSGSSANPTRLAIIDPGVYMIVGNAGVGGANAATSIRLNGATFLSWQYLNTMNTSGTSRTLWRCVPGDYFELVSYQGSGVAQVLQVQSGFSPDLSIVRLGD